MRVERVNDRQGEDEAVLLRPSEATSLSQPFPVRISRRVGSTREAIEGWVAMSRAMAARRVDFPFPRGSSTHSRRSEKHLPNDLPLDGSKSRFRNSPQNRLNRSSSVALALPAVFSELLGVVVRASAFTPRPPVRQVRRVPRLRLSFRGALSSAIAAATLPSRARRVRIPRASLRVATSSSRGGSRSSERMNAGRVTPGGRSSSRRASSSSSTVTLMTCLRDTLWPSPSRDTAQAMSEENVERIRRAAEVLNRGKLGPEDVRRVATELLHPEVEWRDQRELPGATVHHGIEGVERHAGFLGSGCECIPGLSRHYLIGRQIRLGLGSACPLAAPGPLARQPRPSFGRSSWTRPRAESARSRVKAEGDDSPARFRWKVDQRRSSARGQAGSSSTRLSLNVGAWPRCRSAAAESWPAGCAHRLVSGRSTSPSAPPRRPGARPHRHAQGHHERAAVVSDPPHDSHPLSQSARAPSASSGVQDHERLGLRRMLAALVRERRVEEQMRLGRDQREREARRESGVADFGRLLEPRQWVDSVTGELGAVQRHLSRRGAEPALGVRRVAKPVAAASPSRGLRSSSAPSTSAPASVPASISSSVSANAGFRWIPRRPASRRKVSVLGFASPTGAIAGAL